MRLNGQAAHGTGWGRPVARASVPEMMPRWPGDVRSWLSSVRARSALAAATVVAATVGLAGGALVLAAQSILTGNVATAALQRAQQVAVVVVAGDLTDVSALLPSSPADQSVVQVLDVSGQVLAASPELHGRPPLTRLRPPPGVTEQEQQPLDPGEDAAAQIVVVGVAATGGSRVVVVAQSLASTEESVEFLMRSVGVGIPILSIIVGLATFHFVGRSLRPVEAIRRRVASITGQDLAARLPKPATRDEIAALAETMNAMLDRLQSSVESQRRFVADASHELRSPLTTLQVGLDMLSTNANVRQPQVERLFRETNRLSRLVGDLLLLAKADEFGLPARPSEVDLDDVAYRAQERMHTDTPTLRVEIQLRPVRVRGDEHQLDRAIGNLCDNAARHARSKVTIAVWQVDGTAHLTVGDDGQGIDPEDRERVFERFVRLDDSRTRAEGGTGLGLAITREIAHRHGGTVTVETSPHGGALFHYRMPTEPDERENRRR